MNHVSVKEQRLQPFILTKAQNERESFWRRESNRGGQWWGSETGPEYQCSTSERIQGCSAPKPERKSMRGQQHHRQPELDVPILTAKDHPYTLSQSRSTHMNHNTSWDSPHLDFLLDISCKIIWYKVWAQLFREVQSSHWNVPCHTSFLWQKQPSGKSASPHSNPAGSFK